MRCKKGGCRRHYPWRLWLVVALGLVLAAVLAVNLYVDRELKPSMYDYAEYEARAVVTNAMNEAIALSLQNEPTLCADIYRLDGEAVQLNAHAVNRARAQLLAAAQQMLEALPGTKHRIPLGSLTDNSLLGGLGPAWELDFAPQGYVQGRIREDAVVLGVNNTRYSAVLELETVVNMILESDTATLAVMVEIPLASVLVRGGTPTVYATD